MQGTPCFAYSLCQEYDGWRWSVYDQDGVTVAGGADATRAAAQAAVELTLRQAESRSFSPLINFLPRSGTPNRGRQLIARS